MRKMRLFLRYLTELGAFSFLSYLFQRFVSKNQMISIRVRGLSQPVWIKNNPNDIFIFSQIFINKEYEVSLNCTIKTVVDCGANIGLASLFFLSKFKEARIVAIEPERGNFDMLVRNLQSFQKVTCVNRGVWSSKVPLQIMDNGRGDLGFITKPSELNNKNVVDSITIADILEDYQLGEIDILKIDIEGSEEQLFFYNPQMWLIKTKIIFCEIHENMKPGLTDRIIKQLSPHFSYFIHGEYHVFQRRDDRFFKDKIVKESSVSLDD